MCAQALVDNLVYFYSVPLVLLVENDSNFSSKVFSVLTHILGIKHVFASPYRPYINGKTERWNAMLMNTVSH